MSIQFRGDAYRQLFKNKGQIRDGYHCFENAYFPPKFFLQFWDYSTDSHGQGIKVFYPMKIKHFMYWSPKRYRVEYTILLQELFRGSLRSLLLK